LIIKGCEKRFSACQILKNENNWAIMGGSAKRPKDPPPAPAPVRADSAEGEQAQVAASRRQGLRKTIDPDSPLAPSPALGSLGKLGVGALEGEMVNTAQNANANLGGMPWIHRRMIAESKKS
jgi:hypothetical protein